jgi:hypothetical protein
LLGDVAVEIVDQTTILPGMAGSGVGGIDGQRLRGTDLRVE